MIPDAWGEGGGSLQEDWEEVGRWAGGREMGRDESLGNKSVGIKIRMRT